MNIGSRQQRKALTRNLVREAAERVFTDKGFAGAQVGDIARLAGVAHGTVYVHFPSKEALADELLEQFGGALVEHLRDAREAHRDEPPLALLTAVARACLDYWLARRGLLQAFIERAAAAGAVASLRDGISPPVAAFLRQELAALARHVGTEIPDVELVTQGLLGLWVRIGLQVVFRDDLLPERAAEVLARLTLGALVGALGLALELPR